MPPEYVIKAEKEKEKRRRERKREEQQALQVYITSTLSAPIVQMTFGRN